MDKKKNTIALNLISDIILAVIIINFIDYNFIIKILMIIAVSLINKFIIEETIKSLNIELKKIKLEDFHYLGLNPKVQITRKILSLIVIWCFFVAILTVNRSNNIKLWSIFPVFIIIILFICDFYGPSLDRCKLKDGIIYTLEKSNYTGYGILGRKVGGYKNGIVIDKLILDKEEILIVDMSKEGLEIKLTKNRKFIIKDIKAAEYLQEVIKKLVLN
ncbi:hypothetical protein [Clostridium senegalense]|uniref:Uncharacterized protein n=1 Tax=Clostridium senegalense TaxID=1465809 RepID=A0A6M0H0X1_9CLOT|nr:hypothetical protein [Clostridium senegalense]NEU04239.1 hypothetical protein [Clostridium senegalense]